MQKIELLKTDKGYYPRLNEIINYPTVSVVTVTYNRHHIFDIAIDNWNNFIYPKDKIEWIILDDSSRDSIKLLKKKLPKDDRIKYYTLKNKLKNIGEKRNKINELASNEIIIHMDDDDYYPEDSIINRISGLLTYNKKCIGCSSVNCINLLDNSCFQTGGGLDELTNNLIVAEASLGYYKDFWKEQKFDNNSSSEECKEFLNSRVNDYIDLHTAFVMIAITHNKNMSDRVLKNTINTLNFFDCLPFRITKLLEKIQEKIYMSMPETIEALDFVESNKNKNKDIILNKLKKLPPEVRSSSVIYAFIEQITPKETIVENTVNIVYFPNQILRNISVISKNNYNPMFEQLLFFINNSYKNKHVKLFTRCYESFVDFNINIEPWFLFNKQIAADLTVIVSDHGFFNNVFNTNYVHFINLHDLVYTYPKDSLYKINKYITFGDIKDIQKINKYPFELTFEKENYFYLGKSEKVLKNNYIYTEYEDEDTLNYLINKYEKVYISGFSRPNKKCYQTYDLNICEHYLIKEISIPTIIYLIKHGVKYYFKDSNSTFLDYNIKSIYSEIPQDYYEKLNLTLIENLKK